MQNMMIQIQPGDGSNGPAPDQFTPWAIGTGTAEDCRYVAAGKYLRERGTNKHTPRHVFTVFSYPDTAPTHPNGRPLCVNALTLVANG